MCGLAALLLYPQPRSSDVWAAVRQHFTANLCANECRGKAATGVAAIRHDGQIRLIKAPLKASDFVQTAAYQRWLADLDAQTCLLLGHTRQPTKGSPAAAANNHPLHTGQVCGVHNGHICNDDLLFAQCVCYRQAEVDSEIIFRLLDTVPLQAPLAYLQHLEPLLQQLQGDFTFLAGHQGRPTQLLVVKHGRPLSVYHHESWQALLFSSRYLFLRHTFGPRLLQQTLPADQLLLFDADAIPQNHHQPGCVWPLKL